MINLEFVGNKPLITAKGVTFSNSKLDKYEYVEPAIHILELCLDLDEDNPSEKINPSSIYSVDKILTILKRVKPNINDIYTTEISKYKEHLTTEEKEAKQNSRLTEEEIETLVNNFKFMEKYRIQRATNKLVYEEIINSSVELIIEKKISSIKAPFSITFLHVLGSIESTLLQHKNSPKSTHIGAKLDKESPYSDLNIEF